MIHQIRETLYQLQRDYASRLVWRIEMHPVQWDNLAEVLPPSSGPINDDYSLNLYGIRVYKVPDMPRTEIWMKDSSGNVIKKIVGLADRSTDKEVKP